MEKIDIPKFMDAMELEGYFIVPKFLNDDFLGRLRDDCVDWCDICAGYQVAAGISSSGDQTGHHSLGRGDSIDELISIHPYHHYLNSFFEDKPYILTACNPLKGAPGHTTYVHKIHRDVRTYIAGFNLRANILIALDDFRAENGATQFMVRSHEMPVQPEQETFKENMGEWIINKGDAIIFNSYLWHRGGFNSTENLRVALTLSFSPAFIKPQLDYARMLGDEYFISKSELTKQVLGYYSRVPCSHSEWYKLANQRFYRDDQG
jgi:ectoine hydroxylase-related dioxygenase (phytanoyl-CoA dioxygenase family)